MKKIFAIMFMAVFLLSLVSCAEKVEKKDGAEKLKTVYKELITYLESEDVQAEKNEAAKDNEEFEKFLAAIDEKIEEIAEESGYTTEKEWTDAKEEFKDNEEISALRKKAIAMLIPRGEGDGMERGPDNAALIEWEIQQILKDL